MNKPTDIEVRRYMRSDGVLQRFAEFMNQREAERYIASVLLAVAGDTRLQECTPQSVLISAMRAATLGLSVDPVMKQAYLVGFKNRRGVTEATLILHYKGYIRLAFNTGLYDKIHVREQFEGQQVVEDDFGDHKISGTQTGPKVIGRIALFRLFSGFYKDVYMTTEEIRAYGRKYAPDYSNQKSLWRTMPVGDRDNWMEKKTPLRVLFNHWGVFDPAVKKALSAVDEVVDADLTPASGQEKHLPTEVLRDPPQISGKPPRLIESGPGPDTLGYIVTTSPSQEKKDGVEGWLNERPFKPEKLKRVIGFKSNVFSNDQASEEERAWVEEYLDTDALWYLVKVRQHAELTDAQVKALYWWMQSAPITMIDEERRAMWNEAQRWIEFEK